MEEIGDNPSVLSVSSVVYNLSENVYVRTIFPSSIKKGRSSSPTGEFPGYLKLARKQKVFWIIDKTFCVGFFELQWYVFLSIPIQ